MKLKGKILISIEESDIINGVFTNKEVTEVADRCFDQYNGYCPKSLVKVVLPKVKIIGNDNFRGSSFTSVSLPLVTQIGNDNFIGDSFTSVSLPLVTQIGNYNFIGDSFTSVSLPLVTQIGNDNFIGSSFTSVSLPLVTQIGNYNFIGDSFTSVSLPLVTQIGNNNFRGSSFTSVSLRKKELPVKYIDGFCFVIESEKTSKGIKIYTGYNFVGMDKKIIHKTECFVAEKEKFYAHGNTVKKAIGDLQFKIVADKLKNEPIKPDTLFTVMYYRTITGACDIGCRDFMSRNGLEFEVLNKGTQHEETKEINPIKAKDLLVILEKQKPYGFDKFKSLIAF